MQTHGLKNLLVVAVAGLFLAAPMAGNAQHYGLGDHQQNGYNHNDYRYDRRDTRDWINAMERESNAFRAYFEHNFKAYGHKEQRWDRSGDYNHPEHEGRDGQMTLLDAIQNLDEDFERLRTEVDHHGMTRQARSLMDEIGEHSRDVDTRIDRVADTYRFNSDRNWRYDRRSELYRRWQDLKSDIRELDRGVRR